MIRSIIIAAALATSARAADVVLGRIADLTWGGSGTTRIAQWGSAWTPASLNPVAWYKGDGNALDSGVNGLNGTWSGTPAYTNGVNGQAFAINGGSAYVDCGNPAALQITNAITLEVWFRPNGTTAAISTIIGKGVLAGDQRAYGMTFAASSLVPQLRVFPSGTTTGGNILSAAGALPVGAWSHVVCTFQPSTRMAIYTNGVLSAETTTGVPAGIFNSSATAAIGTGLDYGGAGRQPNGQIDDARIYNRALTQSEITQLYNWRP